MPNISLNLSVKDTDPFATDSSDSSDVDAHNHLSSDSEDDSASQGSHAGTDQLSVHSDIVDNRDLPPLSESDSSDNDLAQAQPVIEAGKRHRKPPAWMQSGVWDTQV